MFSRRSAHDPSENPLSQRLRALRASGRQVLDLTLSNPTRAALPLLDCTRLNQPEARDYEPATFGLEVARRAVAEEYARAGHSVDPTRIVITASTSEAYSFLFKLFCDAGDKVLVPTPSYPLFDFLARGEHAQLRHYPLLFDGHEHHYEAALVPHDAAATLALVVSPDNPTGSVVEPSFVEAMHARGLPVVIDEVFGRFSLDRQVPLTNVGHCRAGLSVHLNGLSKQAGLPQLKLAWMLFDGPDALVDEALQRLELIADSFLSTAAPVQHALDDLLLDAEGFRQAVNQRIKCNLHVLRDTLAGSGVSVLGAAGGWYACLRTSAPDGDEAFAVALLDAQDVYVHPGSFFGLTHGAHLVVSLLPPEPLFREACARLRRFVDEAGES